LGRKMAAQAGLERQDLSCTYLAQHELESVDIFIIYYYGEFLGLVRGSHRTMSRLQIIILRWITDASEMSGLSCSLHSKWQSFELSVCILRQHAKDHASNSKLFCARTL